MMLVTSAPPPGSRRNGGSLLRLLFGVVLFLVAIVTAVFGFLRLISVLEDGGYGTPPMRNGARDLGNRGRMLRDRDRHADLGCGQAIRAIGATACRTCSSTRKPKIRDPDHAGGAWLRVQRVDDQKHRVDIVRRRWVTAPESICSELRQR